MADYVKTTNFGAKDSLVTGDSNKLIKGSEFDTEFDALATAVATKHDSSNLATQAEAEAGTNNVALQTPLRAEQHVVNYNKEGAGFLFDAHALADPDADRIAFWDDSAGKIDWLVPGDGIDINGLNLRLTASAATTTNPCEFISGKPEIDIGALANMEGNALVGADTFLVDNGGVPFGIEVQGMGMQVQLSQTSQTLAAGDMNTIMEFNGTATLTIPLNSSTPLPEGAAIIIVVDHATQVVTITAAASVTLNSIFHPAGGSAASDTVISGGVAVLIKTATDDWYLSGDIAT